MAKKEWFTVQELIGLPGMPGTAPGVRFKLKNFLGLTRTKERGKGLEYSLRDLPVETSDFIQSKILASAFTSLRTEARFMQPGGNPGRQALPEAVVEDLVQAAIDHCAIPPNPSRNTSVAYLAKTTLKIKAKTGSSGALAVSKPEASPKKTSTEVALRHAGGLQTDGSCVKAGQVRRVKAILGDSDRAYQDAALLLMHALADAMHRATISARKAAQTLAAHIMDGSAAPDLQAAAVAVYLKPRGVTRLGGLASLTARLQKMHGFYQEGCKLEKPEAFLIAGRPEKRGPKPEHLRGFVQFYCLPNRPSVMQAWKNSEKWYLDQGIERPAVDSWYRLEKELPVTIKYRGRMTGAAFKSLKPYVSRDETMFKSNDIWVGDGHTFKARVQSPIHGNAFRPEVTFLIDWRSRKLVGWSVALSENVAAVSDAFRHAQITTRARPLIYYSDNGSGQTGKHIDHPITGTLGRQGIAHETGIPGSPQGRGIIERVWASTLIPLAATYPTFLGKQADKETIRKVGVELEKTRKKGEVSRLLPSWNQFVDDLKKCVDDYNQHHSHSGVGGMTPDEAYAKYMDPDSTAMYVGDSEINALWMPEEVRSYRRGLVQLFGNEYSCPQLMNVLKEDAKVRVRFDMHNAETVRLLDMETGKFLALGIWDGHRRAAFPVAFVDRLAEKRAQGIKRRAQGEIDRADDELMVTYDGNGAQVLPFGEIPVYREESLIENPQSKAEAARNKRATADAGLAAATAAHEKALIAVAHLRQEDVELTQKPTAEPMEFALRMLEAEEKARAECPVEAPDDGIDLMARIDEMLRLEEEEQRRQAM